MEFGIWAWKASFKKLNYFVLTLRRQRGGRLFRHTTNLLPCCWSMKWYITKLGLMVWNWDYMVSKLHCWLDTQKPRFTSLFYHFTTEFQKTLFFGKMEHYILKQLKLLQILVFNLLLFIKPKLYTHKIIKDLKKYIFWIWSFNPPLFVDRCSMWILTLWSWRFCKRQKTCIH